MDDVEDLILKLPDEIIWKIIGPMITEKLHETPHYSIGVRSTKLPHNFIITFYSFEYHEVKLLTSVKNGEI
jgi:hypothetical protein